MNKKYEKVLSTRNSLLMSIISLILCFAMLIGTTYAWFTDEVTSGVNQIKAGNLDVELYHATSGAVTAGDANKVTSTTKLFNIEHWEPGMVAYENFMVKNVGNLALKYQLAMTVGDFNTVDGHSLKEVLKVAVVPGGFTGTTRADAEALTGYTSLEEFSTGSNGALLPGAAGDTFGVVIYWQPTDNDNLCNLNNGKKATVVAGKFAETELGIELGVKLTAQQLAHEADSFDNQYDAGASGTEPTTVLHEKASSKAIAMTETENTITEIGGESAVGVTDVTVQSTSQIATATVPVSAAQTVMSNLLPGEGVDNSQNREMVLNLNVDTKETTDTSVTYEIGVTADLTYTDNTGSLQQSTTDVHELSEFMTATVKLPSGLDGVTVTHSGNAMEEMESAAATPTNEYGGYYYDSNSGTLTIKSKTFSPFKVSYVLPELKIIWWWPNPPKPYTKMAMTSARYYPNPVTLQVGQMLPVQCVFKYPDGSQEGWVRITSSNPEVLKVTSNISIPIEECQYMQWYSYLYATGEGTATLTFEDKTGTGLVRKDVTVQVTRETTIDKIDIGAYYSFGEFEFKDASGGSLGKHPIDWVVLDKDTANNRIYVVSKDILCDMKYDNSANKTATFDNSSLKTWLNGDFKNGFTDDQKSKIHGDIGLLDHAALPHENDVAGTMIGDWNAAKAQHYGVEVKREGIGSGAVSSANSPKWWVIADDGKATLASMGACQHENFITSYDITNSAQFGVRPAMWIALPGTEA